MLRPFIFALLGVILLISCKQQAETTTSEEEVISTTYYLIRHAEKDRSDPDNKDPMLTDKGRERAEGWKNYFDSIKLDVIYSTGYNRTLGTAKPTAAKKDLEIITYEVQYVFSRDFRNDTKGKKVLVVGHSNTTPPLANKLLGSQKFPDMEDNVNSSLYVVTITDTIAKVEVRTVD
jgi:broad specificity phosphatase PhoE